MVFRCCCLHKRGPQSQGLDVVNAVSRAAVGVANTLDSAIEQLMEGWVSPLDRNARRRSAHGAAHSAALNSAEGFPEEPAVGQRSGSPAVSRAHSRDLVSIVWPNTLPAARHPDSLVNVHCLS